MSKVAVDWPSLEKLVKDFDPDSSQGPELERILRNELADTKDPALRKKIGELIAKVTAEPEDEPGSSAVNEYGRKG